VHQEKFRHSVLPRAPFAIVTGAGLLGVFLPGGTIVAGDLAWAIGLLVLRLAVIAFPWPGRRSRLQLADALIYVAFVAMLVQAQGGSSRSGSYSMALMAILWIALYGGRIEGAITVTVSSAVLIWLSFLDHQAFPAIARKGIIWFLIAAAITFAAHQLRDRFAGVIDQRERTIVRTESLANAVAELTVLRDPDAVLAVGTRVAAALMSDDARGSRRASYFVVEGVTVRMASQDDESGQQMAAVWPIDSHGPMARVAATLKPVADAIHSDSVSGEALRAAEELGVTHGVWIPVMHEDRLHGILSVTTRGAPVDEALSSLLGSLGRVLELALDNAAAHVRLEHQATVDPLTGCANRWGLPKPAEQTTFTVIAADLDGLKSINDTHGHEAGDGVLARFAEVVRSAVRPGDTVARVGGDEFIVLLAGASAETGRQVADRILTAVGEPALAPAIRVSLGIASGDSGTPFEVVSDRADSAMYTAKRAGGMRWSEWSVSEKVLVWPS
jgi:diguanylate cyclase (GGDEF)-like protein